MRVQPILGVELPTCGGGASYMLGWSFLYVGVELPICWGGPSYMLWGVGTSYIGGGAA